MIGVVEASVICGLQLLLFLICIIVGIYHFWNGADIALPTLNPMNDIGLNISRNRVIINPGSFANVLMNDPIFDASQFTQEVYPDKTETEQLARQATQILLRNSVKGTNLPMSLAFIRRCLMFLDQNSTLLLTRSKRIVTSSGETGTAAQSVYPVDGSDRLVRFRMAEKSKPDDG
ncbi:hypothetical protein PHET_07193 [Paragonimus heterotremus]|uniref:Uncharacterized protein n=1 Tax=Paragonimus heterotremus TaxID=100268 RepID=A0A8J4TDS6_9TREM|nr:hypothetical protein PHET_07193 [Paragonimus heterotremus]